MTQWFSMIKRSFKRYYFKSEMYVWEDSLGHRVVGFRYKKFIWSQWKAGFDCETMGLNL